VADDRQQVHQGPALPDPGVRRAEAKAGRTAGFVQEADLASVEGELRAEVEAADAAALQAAIDAAAAQDDAGAALFEAQFGSVVVGRLDAGTLNVALDIGAGGQISAGGGDVTIGSGGIVISDGDGASNELNIGLTRIREHLGTFTQSSPGDVILTAGQSQNADFVIQGGAGFGKGVEIKGYRIDLNGHSGAWVRVNGSRIRTFFNTSIPSGSRTTSQPTWTGGSGSGPNFTSQQNETGSGNHNHNVPGHFHTVTI